MTARELEITRAVLEYLHTLDHGQDTEIGIHMAVNRAWPAASPKPSAAELAACLADLDARRFITGVAGRFGMMKWNLSDAGEAARLEM
jgi:hypothetical protein